MDKTQKIVPIWRQYHLGKKPKLPHCSVPRDWQEDPRREEFSCLYFSGKYCGLLADEPQDICIPAVALIFDSVGDLIKLMPPELRREEDPCRSSS